MTESRLEYLFNRYVNKNFSPEEKEEFMNLVSKPENEAIFKSLIQNVIENTGTETELPAEKANLILKNILQSHKVVIVPMKKRNTAFIPWMRVAAAVFIIVIAGASYWLLQKSNRSGNNKMVSVTSKPLPVLPGTDKALLTMADGRTVVLDSLQSETLTDAGYTNIRKQGAMLIYNSPTANEQNSITYNTLSTPRGGQYKVVLSDGTEVWLNAASSLRFPTAFTGNFREVELTGEAYFEVAKNKTKPFHVMVNGMRVNVLGTHFNVNAYTEEQAIKTSLLEGSVEVINGSFNNRIKPGEQAIVTSKNDVINIRTADMDAVVAWKNGLFEFEGADIATIMRQVARWYDVEIIYTGKVPLRRFEGKISRNAQLSEVLQILELSNIKFRVEGKKIIVQ
jgi:transmembrane sensor